MSQCLPLSESKDAGRNAGDLDGHYWLDGAHFSRMEPSQTGGAFLEYLVGQLSDASLQLAGSPLCLCIAPDFTLQFTFQFRNLQTTMISDHRLAGSKPGWPCTCQLAWSLEREQNHEGKRRPLPTGQPLWENFLPKVSWGNYVRSHKDCLGSEGCKRLIHAGDMLPLLDDKITHTHS